MPLPGQVARSHFTRPNNLTAKMARPVEHNFKSLRAQDQQNTPVSEPQSHNSQYLARLSVDTEEGPLGSPHGVPRVASSQIRVSMRGHTLQPLNLWFWEAWGPCLVLLSYEAPTPKSLQKSPVHNPESPGLASAILRVGHSYEVISQGSYPFTHSGNCAFHLACTSRTSPGVPDGNLPVRLLMVELKA